MTPTEMATAGGHQEVVEYFSTVQSHLSCQHFLLHYYYFYRYSV